jgi:DNA-binding XRE family transcriptional regulator
MATRPIPLANTVPAAPIGEAHSGRTSSFRWQTRFARRVRRYGVANLARELQVDQTAIYQWIRGSVAPRPEKAMLLVQLLRSVGRLTLEDVYRHQFFVGANVGRRPPDGFQWTTRFGTAVYRYGVKRLANDLRVEDAAIYRWIRGKGMPSPENAMFMIAILGPACRLKLEDIYDHWMAVRSHVAMTAAATVVQNVN